MSNWLIDTQVDGEGKPFIFGSPINLQLFWTLKEKTYNSSDIRTYVRAYVSDIYTLELLIDTLCK